VTNELSPYQWTGAKFLAANNHALLADDMGLGKTSQAITAADMVGAQKILVICPAVARVNWQREFAMWSLFSMTFKVCFSGEDEPTDRTIVSYDYATDHVKRLTRFVWDLVINDESHFIKEPEAQRTVAIYGKEGIVRKTKRMWDLSGTPAPNNAAELWPMLFTFGITTLSYTAFVSRFCKTCWVKGHGKPRLKILGNKEEMIPELRDLLKKIMLRRLKEEVMTELPPIKYDDIVVEAGPVDIEVEASFARYIYPIDQRKELFEKMEKEKRIVEETVERLGFTKNGMQVLEGIADSVSTLRRYTGLQKVKETADLITQELEVNAYDKIVIFAIHRDVIEGMRVKLSKFGAVTLYGGTPPASRQKNIDRFQNNPKCRVFIGNIQAAGTAITLTAACQVLFIEQDWVPGNNAQAAMRCHRRGQTRPVFVRFVGLADSIDQKVSQVLKRKAKDLTQIFDIKEPITIETKSFTEGEET
jgi:SWI/SNF-related matrix-associated actin-dependent regulator 1 of chromatin subfamily A